MPLTAAAATAAAAGIGAGSGLLTSIINNHAAKKLAEQDRRENYMYNEMSAENAYKRQIAMTENYMTPEAQVKHLREAGLSPSLMYGGGGTTGQTTAPQGEGASGVQTKMNPFDLSSLMTIAQIKNLNAQTAKTEAETQTEKGENQRGAAEISTQLAEKGYKEAGAQLAKTESDLKEVETKIKSITADVNEETKNDQINQIKSKAEEAEQNTIKAMYAAQNEGLKFALNQATFNDNVEQAAQKTKQLIAENSNIWADTNLKQNQIYQIVENVKLAYRDIVIKENTFKLNKLNFDFEKFKFQKSMELRVEEFNGKLGFEAKKTRTEQIVNLAGKLLSVLTANALISGAANPINQPQTYKPIFRTTTISD